MCCGSSSSLTASLLSVPIWLLRPFLHCADIPQTVLLAAAGTTQTQELARFSSHRHFTVFSLCLQNPDIVLVHYLNVPSLEDSGTCSPLLCTVSDRHDGVRWSRDDLLNQLKPMCKTTHPVALTLKNNLWCCQRFFNIFVHVQIFCLSHVLNYVSAVYYPLFECLSWRSLARLTPLNSKPDY